MSIYIFPWRSWGPGCRLLTVANPDLLAGRTGTLQEISGSKMIDQNQWLVADGA